MKKTLVAVIVAMALIVVPATAKKKKVEAIEAYSGHTLNVNTGPASGKGSTFVDLEIERWTTEEERQQYAKVLAEKGSEALVDSMRDDGERVGWVRLPGTVAYDLKFARAIQTPEGRQIILATDRPVGMRELWNSARTLDYGATIIAFVMPADGSNGEGTIIVGAELKLEDSGQLTIESAALNPVRFGGIKQTK